MQDCATQARDLADEFCGDRGFSLLGRTVQADTALQFLIPGSICSVLAPAVRHTSQCWYLLEGSVCCPG